MTTTGRPTKSWWHREPEAFKRQFVMGNDVSVERLYDELSQVFSELRSIVACELGYMRYDHLVRLRVEIELCY